MKPSADLWGFVRWATTNPLTTSAAASGSSVDSQTISGGPPADVYGSGPAGDALSEMAVVSESLVNPFAQTHEAQT